MWLATPVRKTPLRAPLQLIETIGPAFAFVGFEKQLFSRPTTQQSSQAEWIECEFILPYASAAAPRFFQWKPLIL
jgi:hypothetical protein